MSEGTNTSSAQAATQAAGRPTFEVVWSSLAPFIGLALVVLIFVVYQWLVTPERPFLSQYRMTLIAKQTAIVGMGALGMTVIIISGGIDLSAGSLLAVTSVVLAVSLRAGIDPVVCVLLVLAVGMASGLINGLLITGLRLVPFIVTLGTMMAFRGVAEIVSDNKKVSYQDAPNWLSTLLNAPPEGSYQGVATGVWIVLALALLLAIMLRYTVFGRYVFAIGSSEATARLCGVNVPGMKLTVYTLGGLFMAVAGIFAFANLGSQGSPTEGVGLELSIIAAVVIGGGSLSGGRGSVLGSLLGALMMTTLESGCGYAGLCTVIQRVIVGLIIVGAVAVDQFVHAQRR